MATKQKTKTTTEQIKGTGDQVIKKVKELVKEGNVRKIMIKDKNGKSIAEFPLTIGVIGTALVPILAAVGAIIALVAECTITIEKEK
ncbi:hypothetical protein A3A55_00465 [Candidatus Roizmanbacteria bacterium RIFCSPLOWO2_01_FULL_40_14]|nr:MAG: hypothetical protein A3A55_00465 [Candidatus Roizmanbacteria bacterium RIFCSPLOWO2_01_FULL_40_14]